MIVDDATNANRGQQGDDSRLVTVTPPDRRGETAAVVRAAVAIAVVALLWIGRGNQALGGADNAATEQPWQRLFAGLPGSAQRAVRELHEAALELLRLRDEVGAWPDVATLAADGIEPFAGAAAKRDATFAREQRAGAWQYIGRPAAGATAGALLLQILEPQPGELEGRDPRVPVALDEQHRRLRDGTLLHVSFWIATDGASALPEGFLADPALHGLRQVLIGPSARTNESSPPERSP